MTTTRWMLALAASGLLLTACGGDDNDGPIAEPGPNGSEQVPASASQSSTALVEYLETLAKNPSDTAEPLSVDNFTPPTSDDTEPQPVS